MQIPSTDQVIDAVTSDKHEQLFFIVSVITGFILLLNEGAGIGWSMAFAPLVALPVGILLMFAYMLLLPVILMILCILRVLAAIPKVVGRPSA